MQFARLTLVAFVPVAVLACAEAPPATTPRAAPADTTNAPSAGAAAPGPNGPYVVLPVVGIDVPLFADERRALQAKAITLIAAQGATVAKLEELDPLAAPEPTCRAPRTFEDRARGRWGRAPEVRVVASCEAKPCTITLVIERPGVDGAPAETMDRFDAKVDAPDTVAGWLAAMDKLGPPTGGPGALVGAATVGAPTARAISVAAFGKWDQAPLPTSFDFGACFEEGWVRGRADAVRVAVDASGAATKCEVEPDPQHTSAGRLDCLCKLATAKPFGAGDASRRLEVRVANDLHGTVDVRGNRYAARFQAVRASDGGDALAQLEHAAPRVAACVAAAAAAVPPVSHLRLDVDPMGNVTRVAMDGTNDAFRACCGATLRATPLACGRAGAYHVDAELAVGTVR